MLMFNHYFFFYAVNIFLRCSHPPNKGVVLLLEVLTFFFEFIILKSELHQLLSGSSFAFLSILRIFFIFIYSLPKLCRLSLEPSILLMHFGYFRNVSLWYLLEFLNLSLYFNLILFYTILQTIPLFNSWLHFRLHSDLGYLPFLKFPMEMFCLLFMLLLQ